MKRLGREILGFAILVLFFFIFLPLYCYGFGAWKNLEQIFKPRVAFDMVSQDDSECEQLFQRKLVDPLYG